MEGLKHADLIINADGSITPGDANESDTPSDNWKDAMEKWNEQDGNMQAFHGLG